MLSLGSIVLSLSALIILAGTSYPIFSKSAVDVSFYDDWNLPLAVLINIINGLSIVTGWNNDVLKLIIRRITISLAGSLLLTIFAILLGVVHIPMIILVWSSLFAIFVNIEKLIRNIRLGFLNLGGVISHLGIALLLIGIVGSGKYSQTKHVELPLGEVKNVFGYEFKYMGEELFDSGRKSYFNIYVKEPDKSESVLKPVMFINPAANGIMKIPDIKEMILKDIYFSPVGIEDKKSSAAEQTIELKKGEPFKLNEYDIIFDTYKMDMEQMMMGGEFSLNASIKLIKDNNVEIINLSTLFNQEGPHFMPAKSADGKMEFSLQRILKGDKPVLVLSYRDLSQSINKISTETLVAEISLKPAINLFWFGNIFMLAGLLLAYFKRKKNL